MTIWWQVFGVMALVFAVRALGDDGYSNAWSIASSVSVFLMTLAAAFPVDRSDR